MGPCTRQGEGRCLTGSCPSPALSAMELPELPTPKSSASHVGQPPTRYSKEDICLIAGEPRSQTAQGHHEDALEKLELRCGPYDEATEGKASQKDPCSPQNYALCPPGSLSSVGIITLEPDEGTSRSRQAQGSRS